MDDNAADLAAAQRGDAQAFARLYDRHASVVLSLCRANQRTLADAEDATQETFIRAFRLLEQVDAPTKVRAWLYGIARRVCSERRRAAGRRSKHEAHAMLNHTLDSPVAPDPPQRTAHREQLDRLGDAIDALPDNERLAIHLYYLEPDPVAAASDALGLSRSGFYKLLARARDRLAGLLREVQPS